MKSIVLGLKADLRAGYSDFIINKQTENLYLINPRDSMMACSQKSCELPTQSHLQIKGTSNALMKGGSG